MGIKQNGGVFGRNPSFNDVDVKKLDVDNIEIDGNTISSTDVDGDVNITPNGTGTAILSKSTLSGFPYVPNGWGIYPSSLIVFTRAGDNQTGHELAIDASDYIAATTGGFRITGLLARNQTGGYNQTDIISVLILFNSRADTTDNYVNYAEIANEGVTITSVSVDTAGEITMVFNTANQITLTRWIVEFYMEDEIDPR